MVYAPPRRTALSAAVASKRSGTHAYQAALDALPPHHAAAVREYVAALHAEAAARRAETTRLQAALDARTRGNHHREGEQP